MNEKTVLDVIFSGYGDFFEAERKIADFIVNNRELVVDMTIGQLAKSSEVGEATVSRFCKKCGYKGFHHLKISLAKEIVKEKPEAAFVTNHISYLEMEQSLQNILANKIEELRQTVSMVREENLKIILSRIEAAKSIQFAAVGNTIPVALDGAYKFNQIGILSFANTIWEIQFACIYNMARGDVLIVISSSGASKRLFAMIEAARRIGIVTVAITNNDHSPIAKISDYHITTATREKLFMNEFCFSKVSAMMIIEILYLFLVSKRKDAFSNISRHEDAMADDKL